MLVLCMCFMLSVSALAGTHWVSPTGTAAWASCSGGTPLSGTSACSLNTANTNAVAGDTVYLRGGTYTYTGQYDTALAPTHSGACASSCPGGVGATRITFAAYTGESPLIQETTVGNQATGLALNGVSWIKITGITFKNFMGYPGDLYNGSSYNEISYNSFTFDTAFEVGTWFSIGGQSSPWSTHNWFHHNYISSIHAANPCGESIDLIRIGNEESPPNASVDDYNTVEDNYLESGGHSTLLATSRHNVIRNNIAHNEPWISGCTTGTGGLVGTSTTSLTVGTGSKSLTTQTGLAISAAQPIGITETGNNANAMNGIVTSYTSGTGALVVNVTATGGSGTHTDWTLPYGLNYAYYDNAAYNGLYGHRNFSIGQTAGQSTNPCYMLVEGNRLGFAGVNPNNYGASNLDLECPNIIARYNFLYGAMASGIYFKYSNAWTAYGGTGTGGYNDRVYNNTIYHNGHGYNAGLYGDDNLAYNGQGVAQESSNGAPTINVVKNNLLYQNGYSGEWDICDVGWYPNTNCSADTSLDTVTNNWLTSHGDPQFNNPALTDLTSQNLIPSARGYTATPIPDLTLQASSPAIDGGTYLTTATNSGTGSKSLTVADAFYFQDGTWGSDLARGVCFFPDWIAIGTVANTVQISSINYGTKTITLASPKSWSNGASVWLYKKSDGTVVLNGAAPDYGASEYGVVAQPQCVQAAAH